MIRTAGGAAQRLGDVHHVHDVGLDAVAAALDLWCARGQTGGGVISSSLEQHLRASRALLCRAGILYLDSGVATLSESVS